MTEAAWSCFSLALGQRRLGVAHLRQPARAAVFSKLELTNSSEDRRRVLAVLRVLSGPGEG